ncbi:MAG TPA: hypothetical protein EYP60_09325 [bacterium (Candidatus Stahlbacteria)]|nr:hypothetical protein [Candidatus Stahlbacteria bacterium]
MIYSESKKIIPLEEVEKRILAHALKLSKGNISKAARGLHIGRATLYRKIRRYGLMKRELNKYRVSE